MNNVFRLVLILLLGAALSVTGFTDASGRNGENAENNQQATRDSDELKDEFDEKVEADTQLQEFDLEAEVEEGVMTITGEVPSDELSRKAEQLAMTIEGVQSVENELEVTDAEETPQRMLSDSEMKTELEDKIAADSVLKDADLEVEVQQGQARVMGIVSSDEARSKVDELADTVAGLSDVDNQLQVEPEAGIARAPQNQQDAWSDEQTSGEREPAPPTYPENGMLEPEPEQQEEQPQEQPDRDRREPGDENNAQRTGGERDRRAPGRTPSTMPGRAGEMLPEEPGVGDREREPREPGVLPPEEERDEAWLQPDDENMDREDAWDRREQQEGFRDERTFGEPEPDERIDPERERERDAESDLNRERNDERDGIAPPSNEDGLNQRTFGEDEPERRPEDRRPETVPPEDRPPTENGRPETTPGRRPETPDNGEGNGWQDQQTFGEDERDRGDERRPETVPPEDRPPTENGRPETTPGRRPETPDNGEENGWQNEQTAGEDEPDRQPQERWPNGRREPDTTGNDAEWNNDTDRDDAPRYRHEERMHGTGMPRGETGSDNGGGQASESDRSDTAIGAELRGKLFADSELSGWDISTDVENGVVTMEGEVPNDQTREKADKMAQTIAGVSQVENELTVRGEPYEPDMDRSDTAMGMELKAKMAADSELSAWGINVDVENGNITMEGEVETDQERQKAEQLAMTIEGARQVENRLEVAGEMARAEREQNQGRDERTALDQSPQQDAQQVFDKMAEDDIRERFERTNELFDADINVSVVQGRAILWGIVNSEEQKQLAEDIATEVEGVKEVRNDIRIMVCEIQEPNDNGGEQEEQNNQQRRQNQR